ncbi:MAG TPA: DUF456 domain-containing protein [Steroidobacteraceae bacterium]|nr:DUF456 domain-containing protein [Steroidobacteraceae bacterium]
MSGQHVALWCLALALMLAGLAGTMLPALPGLLLIYGGIWLAAWLDGYARIGWITLTVLGALTVLGLVTDVVSGLLGARRVGASPQALWGSTLGGLVGLFFGLPGLVLGPFTGAVAGEWLARRELGQATRVGFGTWLGLVFGALVKLVLAITMVGIFIADYLIHSRS